MRSPKSPRTPGPAYIQASRSTVINNYEQGLAFMASPPLYQALKDIKLTTVRKAISPGSYSRSAVQTFGWYAFDLALYLGLMSGVFAAHAWRAKLLFGLGGGWAGAVVFGGGVRR